MKFNVKWINDIDCISNRNLQWRCDQEFENLNMFCDNEICFLFYQCMVCRKCVLYSTDTRFCFFKWRPNVICILEKYIITLNCYFETLIANIVPYKGFSAGTCELKWNIFIFMTADSLQNFFWDWDRNVWQSEKYTSECWDSFALSLWEVRSHFSAASALRSELLQKSGHLAWIELIKCLVFIEKRKWNIPFVWFKNRDGFKKILSNWSLK